MVTMSGSVPEGGLGLLGLLVVGYGVYHDMIGWTLPTYAAY